MVDTSIVIGLDLKPSRVHAVWIDPAFGINIGEFRFAPTRTMEALEDEIRDWEPFSGRYDFRLSACPEDPWPAEIYQQMQARWTVQSHTAEHVATILQLASKICGRSLASQRANLLGFMGRWYHAHHTDGVLARAWALHLARDQFYHILTEEWPDFFYDDISGEPMQPSLCRQIAR